MIFLSIIFIYYFNLIIFKIQINCILIIRTFHQIFLCFFLLILFTSFFNLGNIFLNETYCMEKYDHSLRFNSFYQEFRSDIKADIFRVTFLKNDPINVARYAQLNSLVDERFLSNVFPEPFDKELDLHKNDLFNYVKILKAIDENLNLNKEIILKNGQNVRVISKHTLIGVHGMSETNETIQKVYTDQALGTLELIESLSNKVNLEIKKFTPPS